MPESHTAARDDRAMWEAGSEDAIRRDWERDVLRDFDSADATLLDEVNEW